MKKYIFLFLALFVMASCSLNEQPKDAIDVKDAVNSVASAGYMTNNLYLKIEGLTSGSAIYESELMADSFNATVDFGNRGGTYYRWLWTADDSFMESYWGACYTATQQANLILAGIAGLDTKNLKDADFAELKNDQGVCYFTKAYTAYLLALKYCKTYNSSTASSDMGVMLVDDYNLTPSDWSTYPGRSTLKETYDYITSNLSKAATCFAGVKGAVASTVLTKECITAMQARVALSMGNYDDAAAKAGSLCDSGTYPLVAADATYSLYGNIVRMWKNDSGTECIMQMYADYTEKSLPSSNDPGYLGDNLVSTALQYSPDYFPSKYAIYQMVASQDDYRGAAWFNNFHTYDITFTTTSGPMYLFNKFAGNPALQAKAEKLVASDHINKIKLFRIAEQYLIAAEANLLSGATGSTAKAQKYLDDLLSTRYIGYTNTTSTGSALLSKIRLERYKELMGEGFRFDDLKRFGAGMTRYACYSFAKNMVYLPGDASTDVMVQSSDNFRWLWPIPKAEIDANPQISKQQNPGY